MVVVVAVAVAVLAMAMAGEVAAGEAVVMVGQAWAVTTESRQAVDGTEALLGARWAMAVLVEVGPARVHLVVAAERVKRCEHLDPQGSRSWVTKREWESAGALPRAWGLTRSWQGAALSWWMELKLGFSPGMLPDSLRPPKGSRSDGLFDLSLDQAEQGRRAPPPQSSQLGSNIRV